MFHDELLITYLNDHLAGSVAGVSMAEHLSEKAPADEQPILRRMVDEIKQDQALLERVIEAVGGHQNAFKQTTAWLGEMLSRLKLGHQRDDELGRFEQLEALMLGVQGKLALWTALLKLQPADARLRAFDFNELAASAERQQRLLNELRLETAYRVMVAGGSQN